jgi:anti-sigma28 factor (negative regulator of flagellin synthesis)
MQSAEHNPRNRDREIQRARQVIEETPDVREERVAAAKLALQAGELNVRGEDLAEKLLADPLHSSDLEA